MRDAARIAVPGGSHFLINMLDVLVVAILWTAPNLSGRIPD
jgi:hypothetical protein